MRLFFYCLFSLTLIIQSKAQLNLENKDIKVELVNELGLVYYHQLSAGQTLYSLSKRFNIKLSDLLRLNKIDDVTDIEIGHTIAIPFDPSIMSLNCSESCIPIKYQVNAKETLYRISKHYFDQDVEEMVNRNMLHSLQLSLNQELIVGYLPKVSNLVSKPLPNNEDIKPEIHSAIPEDTIGIYIKNKLFATEIDKNTDKKILTSAKEIANWDKSAPDHNTMVALHSFAEKNTIIEIHNPLLNRTAYATVIGRVPKDTYTSDVTLLISPKVAKALGALDSRFMVEVKYYR